MQPFSTRNWLTWSLRKINVASAGFTPTAYQMNNALFELNAIIDSWNINGSLIFTQEFQTFDVGGGVQTYTMGPDGDWQTNVRPSYIENVMFRVLNEGGPANDVPLRMLSAAEWSLIGIKEQSSQIPTAIYISEAWPESTAYIWPAPAAAGKVILTTWSPLNSDLLLDDIFSMPPGYARALFLNVANNIAAEYGKVANPDDINRVESIKRDLLASNFRPNWLVYPSTIMGDQASGTYNILTDNVQ